MLSQILSFSAIRAHEREGWKLVRLQVSCLKKKSASSGNMEFQVFGNRSSQNQKDDTLNKLVEF